MSNFFIAKTYSISADCDDCDWLVDAANEAGLSVDKIEAIMSAAEHHACGKDHNVTVYRDLRLVESVCWGTDRGDAEQRMYEVPY